MTSWQADLAALVPLHLDGSPSQHRFFFSFLSQVLIIITSSYVLIPCPTFIISECFVSFLTVYIQYYFVLVSDV